MTYNGWTNYETWVLYTHLTNDEGLYHGAVQAAREGPEVLRERVLDTLDNLVAVAGDRVGSSDPVLSLLRDLMLTSLQNVSWGELAEALKEE